MKKYNAKQIAEYHKVEKRVAQGWLQRGLFPTAEKESHPVFGEYWVVPERDVKKFTPPRRGPRKAKKNLTANL